MGHRTPAALCLAHHNAHNPLSPLGSDPIGDRNPITVKRHRRPISESGSLQSSSAGVRYPGAGALGIPARRALLWASLEPPPPLQQPAPPPVPVDRVEVSSVLPPTPNPKKDTEEPHTPVAVRAATCTRTDRWEAPSGIQRDRWETPPIPGIEPPPSRQAPAALPLERLPSEGLKNSTQGARAQAHTPTSHAGAPAPPNLPTPCMAVC